MATFLASPRRRRNEIFARKQLILRRAINATQWRLVFPNHDFASGRLRLRQESILAPPRGWNESWSAAAREYAEERRSQGSHFENVVKDTATRPTPQTTIEAILFCVRECGLSALKEPENIERLSRCDAAAREQINRRIERLGLK